MDNALSFISEYIPSELDLMSMVKFTLIFAAATLLMGLIGRFALGKRSNLNHAVSSSIGILVMYGLTIVVLTFPMWNLEDFLSPLPFVTFQPGTMVISTVTNVGILPVARQVLALVIIAFLMNVLDSLFPKGGGIIRWYLFRFLSVIAAMGLHYVVNLLLDTYLPGVLMTYAPMILLGILGFMLLLGILKVLLGLVLTAVNPILGAIYTFFFANKIGKMLSKAVLTTVILCAVVYAIEYFGFNVIAIDEASLISYLPFVGVMLIMWYLVGHVL